MLPTITLNPSALCTTAFDHGSFELRIVGHNVVLAWDVLEAEAEASDLGVDAILLDVFENTLASAPDTPPFLVFWGVRGGRILLTMSTQAAPFDLNLRWKLPACLDSARGFITANSKPWLMWDGEQLTRLHELPIGGLDPQVCYVGDVGSYFGLMTGPAPRRLWQNLHKTPGRYPAYTAIPQGDDCDRPIRHRFWTLSPTRSAVRAGRAS